MRRDLNDIEIQEPPLQEMGKKRSCLRRSCFSGCGCVVFLIVGSLFLAKYALLPKSKELKDLPPQFPAEISVYDKEAIHSIAYTSAQDRSEWIKKIATVPRVLLGPVIANLEKTSTSTDKTLLIHVQNFLNNPITKEYDTVRVEWNGLTAAPAFIEEFYKNELKKNNVAIHNSTSSNSLRQFTFEKGDTNGVLFIQDNADKEGTDLVTLTVNYHSAPTP